MSLVGRGQSILTAHIVCHLEAEIFAREVAVNDRPEPRLVGCVLEPRQRVGHRGLDMIDHAARKRVLPTHVVRPAVVETHLHRAEPRERTLARVAVVVVDSGGGVVPEVNVRIEFLVAAAGIDDVRLERHRGADLVLDADRRLVAVRHLPERTVDLGDELPDDAASTVVVQIARVGQHRAERRVRAVERVRREICPAIVRDQRRGADLIEDRLMGLVLGALRKKDPVAAPNNGPIVQRVRQTDARRDVVLVAEKGSRQERRQNQFLTDVVLIVVPDTEVECDP